MSMIGRIRARVLAREGRAPRIVMALACLFVVWTYWTNDDHAGKPDAPRGTGEYLPVIARGDGHMLYLMARSTAFDLDWQFDNDLAAFGDPWGQPRSPTGRKEIPHPIGPALIWTPLVWVAHAGAQVANVAGAGVAMHGYTEWHQRFVFLSCVLAALLSILLGRHLARTLIPSTWSPTYAAIAVLLGTSITDYATYMPSYGHALDAGACAAFLGTWALTRGQCTWRRFISLGALLGLAMLIRVQDVALGVVVALEVAVVAVGELRQARCDWRLVGRWLAGGALVLAVALVVFTPQLYYWQVTYGDWRALPQGARYTRLGSPMILELLYAPRNGWFSTTPIAYLAVIGLVCVPRQARFVALGLGLALAVQVYLNAAIFDWWGMSSWGQRRLCSVTIVLVFGLAGLLWRLGTLATRVPRVPRIAWHVLAIAVLGAFVAWNVWRIRELAGGKGAPSDPVPTCCEKVPERLRPALSWLYARIGNPFQFPASAWFAAKHGVDITRWDQAVGHYALMPSAQSLRSDAVYAERGAWRIGYPKAEPYLIGHWSASHTGDDKPMRWTVSPRVTVLVPILMPEPHRFTLTLAPGGSRDVTVRWDGQIVARGPLRDGWQHVVFDVMDVSVGEHELTLEATPAPFAPRDGWPRPRLPVGVAVNLLELALIRP
jgi:hypothetical protein